MERPGKSRAFLFANSPFQLPQRLFCGARNIRAAVVNGTPAFPER
jgi:hypothetical protein